MEEKDLKEVLGRLFSVLDSKKGEDIRVIDIRGISVIADYFIVASAGNQNHLLALQDAVDEEMSKHHVFARSIEGNRNSTWILMDYEDIIVQLFTKEDRLFYDLERIWKDGTVMDPESL